LKIVSTTRLPLEGFEAMGNQAILFPEAAYFTREELLKEIVDADILIASFDYQIDQPIIRGAKQLRLIANFGVGYNNIDLFACKQQGIRVTNTPQPVIEPTAELAFALMISVARRTAEFDRQLRVHQAEPFGVMNNLSHSLYGKTLGIIGMGRIGQALARRAQASGMRIIYHNRKRAAKNIEQLYHAQYVGFTDLLRQADFVSLNLPFTPSVHHLIDATALSQMKPTAYLINTARGAHVDEQALIDALKQKQIAGAALDVYEAEPHISEELLSLPNVVLSPHTGTGTWEGRIDMCRNVSGNILAFLNNETDKMNIVI